MNYHFYFFSVVPYDTSIVRKRRGVAGEAVDLQREPCQGEDWRVTTAFAHISGGGLWPLRYTMKIHPNSPFIIPHANTKTRPTNK